MKVAAHLDARLYPPVPLEGLEDFLLEEEARVEPAHVPVRFGAAVLQAAATVSRARRLVSEPSECLGILTMTPSFTIFCRSSAA